MIKKIDPCLLALLVFCSRLVVFGASIGDAVAIASLSGLYGYTLFLKSVSAAKKETQVSELEGIQAEVRDLKSAVNAIKIGKSLGKII